MGWLECFAGISGDMLLGALIDAGVPAELLQNTAAGLGIGAELRVHSVVRSGIRATKVDVLELGRLAEGGAQEQEKDHHPRNIGTNMGTITTTSTSTGTDMHPDMRMGGTGRRFAR